MVSKQKQKGTSWENEVKDILQERLDGKWKRIAGSGAMGTSMDEPLLTGDVVGKIDAISKSFRLEAKTGYGSASSLRVQREWLDKIRKEAEATYSLPILACKFAGHEGSRKSKYFVVLDMDTFIEILLEADKLRRELDKTVWSLNQKNFMTP